MPVSYSSHILGQIVDTRRMNIKTLLEFIADMIRLIHKSFHRHQKVFRLQDIESITGKRGHIASTAPWLRFLLPNLYAEIAQCLGSHKKHLYMTNKFRTLLKLHQDPTAPHNHKTFAIAKTAKAVHLLRHQQFISKQLTNLMTLIKLILTDDSISRCCPIAHLVPGTPLLLPFWTPCCTRREASPPISTSGSIYSGQTTSRPARPRHARVTQLASMLLNTLPSLSSTLPPPLPSYTHRTKMTHTPPPSSSPTTWHPRHGFAKGPKSHQQGRHLDSSRLHS